MMAPCLAFFMVCLQFCNCLNFAKNTLGKFLDGAAASGRLAGEESGIDLIECGKITHISDKAGGLYYLFRGGSGGREQGADIAAALLRLGGDALGNVSCDGVHGDLAGAVDKISGDNCLGIGSNGGGCIGCGNDLHKDYPFLFFLLV